MKSKMKIVPVASLKEAIEYLRDNYEKNQDFFK